jgi:hypothetical protein
VVTITSNHFERKTIPQTRRFCLRAPNISPFLFFTGKSNKSEHIQNNISKCHNSTCFRPFSNHVSGQFSLRTRRFFLQLPIISSPNIVHVYFNIRASSLKTKKTWTQNRSSPAQANPKPDERMNVFSLTVGKTWPPKQTVYTPTWVLRLISFYKSLVLLVDSVSPTTSCDCGGVCFPPLLNSMSGRDEQTRRPRGCNPQTPNKHYW